MYLVNTSFAVEPAVHEQWLSIIKNNYIPLIEKAGFKVMAFSRVISIEAVQHFTYSLLVEVADMGGYKELTGDIFGEYITIADPLFGSNALWFTTLMKRIE